MKKVKDEIKNKGELKKSYKRFYDKCINKAKKMIPEKKKISKTIRKARKIIERLHNLPKFESLSNNICNFCDLVSDYLDGIYTKLPLSTIVALVAGLLYAVLPFDVLADFLPFVGWVDDATVLGFVFLAEQNDINEYLEWKSESEEKELLS